VSYKIGQVLFVAPKGKTQLIPIQVVEEITKKTLKGDIVVYMVKPGSEGKMIDIATVDGEIFETAAAAQKSLTERAARYIAKLVANSSQQAQSWYPNSFESTTSSSNVIDITQERDVSPDEMDGAIITLEDGTKARIKLPQALKA
jgi:hypothetical protein